MANQAYENSIKMYRFLCTTELKKNIQVIRMNNSTEID